MEWARSVTAGAAGLVGSQGKISPLVGYVYDYRWSYGERSGRHRRGSTSDPFWGCITSKTVRTED